MVRLAARGPRDASHVRAPASPRAPHGPIRRLAPLALRHINTCRVTSSLQSTLRLLAPLLCVEIAKQHPCCPCPLPPFASACLRRARASYSNSPPPLSQSPHARRSAQLLPFPSSALARACRVGQPLASPPKLIRKFKRIVVVYSMRAAAGSFNSYLFSFFLACVLLAPHRHLPSRPPPKAQTPAAPCGTPNEPKPQAASIQSTGV